MRGWKQSTGTRVVQGLLLFLKLSYVSKNALPGLLSFDMLTDR